MTESGSDTREEGREAFLADLLASMVVFLVALPLCIGIAVASGVPPERGLVTGIVGGLVVGTVSGSPLLVSGPAASLIVLVWELVSREGLSMLGPVVVGAGILQMVAGTLRMGRWFRAVSPAVIRGMLSGIGALILASQLHVMLDGTPESAFFTNLVNFPAALVAALSEGSAALGVGVLTITVTLAWQRWRSGRLALVPPQLLAVLGAVGAGQLLDLEVRYLEVAGSLADGLEPIGLADLAGLASPGLLGQCVVFAFIASAATLLSATAVDQMQTRVRTDYDKELFAQGVGNAITGGLGGLPMTGVIVRSSANVEAGARTRRSTILHGAWLLGFVTFAPAALALIPRAALGAILVVVGANLARPGVFRELAERSRSELLVGLVTFGGVVGLDLFSGILLGLGASILRLLHAFTRFAVQVEDDGEGTVDVHLEGFATFMRLPVLAAALDRIPAGAEVHVHLNDLDYADHACLEALAATERRVTTGEGSFVVEWSELLRRYEEGPSRDGEERALAARMGSLRRVLHATERLVGGDTPREWPPPSRLRMSADRVLLDLPGGDLGETLEPVLTRLLDGLERVRALARRTLLDQAVGRALHLGHGVVLIHASLPGVGALRLVAARLREPVRLAGGSGNLLFVMLDDTSDPEGHLLALGCLAYACMAPRRLSAIRAATTPEELARRIEEGALEAERLRRPDPGDSIPGELLVMLEVSTGATPGGPLVETLRRVFDDVETPPSAGGGVHRWLAETAGVSGEDAVLLLKLTPDQLPTLEAMLSEYSRTTGRAEPRVHVLRMSAQPLDRREVVGWA